MFLLRNLTTWKIAWLGPLEAHASTSDGAMEAFTTWSLTFVLKGKSTVKFLIKKAFYCCQKTYFDWTFLIKQMFYFWHFFGFLKIWASLVLFQLTRRHFGWKKGSIDSSGVSLNGKLPRPRNCNSQQDMFYLFINICKWLDGSKSWVLAKSVCFIEALGTSWNHPDPNRKFVQFGGRFLGLCVGHAQRSRTFEVCGFEQLGAHEQLDTTLEPLKWL